MREFINLTGKKFGKLTVMERANNDKSKNTQWVCKCDCGKIAVFRADHLKKGATKSCGCSKGEAISISKLKHGMRRTKLYGVWNSMIQRCKNPNTCGARLYHDRGISVCPEWQEFETFKNWALQNGYADNFTIDRIDNNKGYYPENCRWVDLITQANNKRTNRIIEFNGEKKTLAQWVREYNAEYGKVWLRLKRGWDFERALLGDVA